MSKKIEAEVKSEVKSEAKAEMSELEKLIESYKGSPKYESKKAHFEQLLKEQK